MSLRIYTVYHEEPAEYVRTEIFHPILLSNQTPPWTKGWQIDSLLHPSFAEVRAHETVWRRNWSTQAPTYVGFQHYRRQLFLPSAIPAHVPPYLGVTVEHHERHRQQVYSLFEYPRWRIYERWCTSVDTDLITSFVNKYDVITSRAWPWLVEAQWNHSHPVRWQRVVECLEPDYPHDVKYFYPANLMIMRWSVFTEYMTFWWFCMSRFIERVRPPEDPYQRRLYGFVSERLLTLWLARHGHRFKLATLPHIFCPEYPLLQGKEPRSPVQPVDVGVAGV